MKKKHILNKIRDGLHKMTAGKPAVYKAKNPKIQKLSPQASRMRDTLEKNRKAGKHSSGRGVGY